MAVVDFGERLAARQAQSDTLVQDLARELGSGADAIAAALTVDLLAAERRLVDADDPRLAMLAHRFAASTVGMMLSGLAFGMPMDAARPTDATLALFERLAERDDGLAVALRAQRLLASELWQVWAVFVGGRVADRSAHEATLTASTRQLDAYVDRVSEHLATAWPEARRRRRRGLGVPAEELVGRAVHGGEAAARAALAELGLPLDASYVAVALPPALGRDELEALARHVQVACAAPTLACADGGERTLWVAFARAEDAQRPERIRPLGEIAGPLGAGDAGTGIVGFRRTREQARDALRVATLGDMTGLTRHRDVALLAVLCADETRARDLARIELGPLAGDDELAVRLRETIAAYLDAGESQVAAAQRLFVHEKTVKYRLRQAEELLGCKIGERRDELSAALMVHRAFGVTT